MGLGVKNPPAVQETQERPVLGGDSLEERMAPSSSILPWRIHGQEWGLQSTGSAESDTTELTNTSTFKNRKGCGGIRKVQYLARGAGTAGGGQG